MLIAFAVIGAFALILCTIIAVHKTYAWIVAVDRCVYKIEHKVSEYSFSCLEERVEALEAKRGNK